MTIGRVGRADARPADVTGGRVRVDRGHSPLGNPFVLGGEEDREAACEAYDLLLAEALELPSARGVMGWSAAAIGAARGFTGVVGGWDREAAADEMWRLRLLSRRGGLRLDCHCCPRRCHAESVRARLMACAGV